MVKGLCIRVMYASEDPRNLPGNIKITNLDPRITTKEVYEIFSWFGPITSCRVMSSYGYVCYNDTDIADQAIEKASGLILGEKAIELKRCLPKNHDEVHQHANRTGVGSQVCNLYIKNLAPDTTDRSLKELFNPFGAVKSAKAILDPDGSCQGFGFVSFGTMEEAWRAVAAMHLKVVKGKALYVGPAEKKAVRQQRLRQHYGNWSAHGETPVQPAEGFVHPAEGFLQPAEGLQVGPTMFPGPVTDGDVGSSLGGTFAPICPWSYPQTLPLMCMGMAGPGVSGNPQMMATVPVFGMPVLPNSFPIAGSTWMPGIPINGASIVPVDVPEFPQQVSSTPGQLDHHAWCDMTGS